MQDQPTEKKCPRCEGVKALEEFSLDRRRRDGRQSRCKGCQRELMREWREQNPHTPRDYYERNRARMNAGARRWREANPEKMVFYQQRHRAGGGTTHDRDEIAEAMAYSLILQGDPCSYCGGPATELDHIIPIERGGMADWDNLTAACRRCNARKHKRPLLDALIRGTMLSEMVNWQTRWEQCA